jgi:LuxR family transcriptional regulator, maltose regulon positive regulatory protein
MPAGTANRAPPDTPGSETGRAGPPRFEFAEWKLRLPSTRPGTIYRVELVDRLLACPATPVVSITGAPGYGKSTLLAQWAERSESPVASVSLDPGDNDPAVLLAYLAGALDRVEPIDVDACRTRVPHGSSVPVTVARRIAAVMSSMSVPVTLMLDHVEAVRNPRCRDAIAELAAHLPPGHRFAVASRGEPPLPIARLRSSGCVLEIGVDDLAMDVTEARALVDAAGAHFDDTGLAELHRRTEGWPVGLYLAALASLAGHGGAGGDEFLLTGDDRLVADYLRSELLSRLPDRTVTFLTRTSVLERLTGPLCDAVTRTEGSGGLLESLARSNLLVVPLDRRGEWYRYHNLFGGLLRSELDLREPRAGPQLHGRAAAWYVAHGLPEVAIPHAQAAGDTDRVARLVAELTLPAYAAGRVDTCLAWIQWFADEGLTGRYPEVAVLGAVLHALLGHAAAADEWAASSERGDAQEPLPDGSTLASWRAQLRACLCRSGVGELRRDTELALEGLAATSQWRASALGLQGVAYMLDDEPGLADTVLAQAVEVAMHAGANPAGSVALAERALLALERRDQEEADHLVDQASALMVTAEMDDYPVNALVHVVAGRAAAQRGDVETARARVAQAARLRVGLTHAFPVIAVQTRLELARAYLELSDAAGARVILREVRDILQIRPDMGNLPAEADRLRDKLTAMGPGTVGASSLTTAELRLLPMLPTHLTFREMGERLHVSRHTVKTQAMSVYRKLGVSSRSEAIARVQEVGLLSD